VSGPDRRKAFPNMKIAYNPVNFSYSNYTFLNTTSPSQTK